MSLIVNGTEKNGTDFMPIEPGTYPAYCYGVVDLGTQHSEAYNNDAHKVMLLWELPTETYETEGKTHPRIISKRYTASLNSKATLYKNLVAWRGKEFAEEELKGFNLASIVGASCTLTISNYTGTNGKTYADVSAVGKKMKGIQLPEMENMGIVFDIDSDVANTVYNDLPQWIKEIICNSEEWKDRKYANAEEEAEHASSNTTSIPKEKKEKSTDWEDEDDDQDLPF